MNDRLWSLERVLLSGPARPRLDGVTLEFAAGVTAILGPSGAGKTSLLNLLVGFERPDSGQIVRCFDCPSERLPLFWNPPGDGLWPHLTVGDHLRVVAPSSASRAADTAELLSAFDLADKTEALPDQLSQGECARLAVARSLAADPCVLVLDEPLVHVDPARAWRYWDVLRAHRRAHGRECLVFSTHSPDVVIREAEHVVCLNEGRVVYSGSVRQLYTAPPTVELGWSLGPINWIVAAERASWLGDGVKEDFGCRPERLAVTPAPDSPLIVQSTRDCGTVAEMELLDERTGQKRRFFHRAQANSWRTGDHVLLKIMALFLVCLLAIGCNAGDAAPKLAVKSTTCWSMPAEGASIPAPRAVHATPAGEIYVLDNAGRVLVFDDRGALVRKWWMPEYSVGKPEKIVLLRDGRLAVADTHYHRVVFFDCRGTVVETRGSLGHDPGQFVYPVAVTEDDSGNLYVGEYGGNDRVQKFDRQGKFLLAFGRPGTGPGEFQRPSGIAWHASRIYVVDAFNNRIQVFDEKGEFQTVLGGEEGTLHYPYDIVVGAMEKLFVVEYAAGRVSQFDLQGKLLGRYGVTGASQGEFMTPWGLTVDSKSRVFVADTGNRRVVELDL